MEKKQAVLAKTSFTVISLLEICILRRGQFDGDMTPDEFSPFHTGRQIQKGFAVGMRCLKRSSPITDV
jgi:hypothetical protein